MANRQLGFDDLGAEGFASVTAVSVGGYRGPAVCQIVGISYRQLDYWARTGLVEPSVRAAAGSGSQRLYGFGDLLLLRLVKRLLDAGISLQNIRTVVDGLRDRRVEDLVAVTLMSDGASVYECTSDDEVIDLLRGGQGVFAVAIGVSVGELTARVAEFPADVGAVERGDELSARRRRRSA